MTTTATRQKITGRTLFPGGNRSYLPFQSILTRDYSGSPRLCPEQARPDMFTAEEGAQAILNLAVSEEYNGFSGRRGLR